MNFIQLKLVGCVFFPLVITITALTGAPNDAKSLNGADGDVMVRFASFSRAGGGLSFALRYPSSNGKPATLSEGFDLPSSSFGRPIPVESRTFEFGRLTDADSANAGQEGSFHRLQTLSLPEFGRAFLILLLPTEVAGRVDFQIIRADDPEFSKGDLQFFNLGSRRIGWRLGDDQGMLDPHSRQRVRPPTGEEGNRSYHVQFASEEETGLKRFVSTVWVRTPQVRSFVFFYRHPGTKRYSYRVIEESPLWFE